MFFINLKPRPLPVDEMPCRKRRSNARKSTGRAVTVNGIRCGNWLLRSTKSRLCRGHHLGPRTPAQLAPKSKRYHIAATTESQNSCTGATKKPRKAIMEGELDEIRRWPDAHTEAFINILLEEQSLSFRFCSKKRISFKDSQWTKMEKELMLKMGTNKYTKERMKSKLKRLRDGYRLFKPLVEHTGFGWDPVSQTVVADDNAWSLYLQHNPKAEVFRYKGLPHYDILKQLFSISVATGALGHSNNESALDFDEEMSMSQGQGLEAGTASGSRNKRKSYDTDGSHGAKAMFENLGKFLAVRTSMLEKGEGASAAECNQPHRPTVSVTDALTLLRDYVDVIPLETYLKASKIFKTKPTHTATSRSVINEIL